MIAPQKLSKVDVGEEPHQIWNAFIDMVACGDRSEMSDIQRKTSLCFWYDSELQNGGHLQYFENTTIEGNTNYQEVIDALKWLGANSQAEILVKAITIRKAENRGFIKDVAAYVTRENEGRYEDLDFEYYHCEPEITHLFRVLLEKYQDEFVLIESD